jgi:hypothetical protein
MGRPPHHAAPVRGKERGDTPSPNEVFSPLGALRHGCVATRIRPHCSQKVSVPGGCRRS